jgi:hypothetical protein
MFFFYNKTFFVFYRLLNTYERNESHSSENFYVKILVFESESKPGNGKKISGSESEKNEFGSTTLIFGRTVPGTVLVYGLRNIFIFFFSLTVMFPLSIASSLKMHGTVYRTGTYLVYCTGTSLSYFIFSCNVSVFNVAHFEALDRVRIRDTEAGRAQPSLAVESSAWFPGVPRSRTHGSTFPARDSLAV